MAGTIKHRFQSSGTDSSDASLVRKTEWNDSLVVAGGSNSQLMQRDTGASDGWSLLASALAYAQGGTGATSYTTNRLLKAGASAFANSLLHDDGSNIGTVVGAQLRVYNLGDGSGDYEALALFASSNIFQIGTVVGGSGVHRTVRLAGGGGDFWELGNNYLAPTLANGQDLGTASFGIRALYQGVHNGAYARLVSGTELLTLSGATTDTTAGARFPANSVGLGISLRVQVEITGCTTFDVGVAGDTTRYGTGLALTVGTTRVSPGGASLPNYSALTALRFTAIGGGASFSAGQVRVVTHYIDFNAPTS